MRLTNHQTFSKTHPEVPRSLLTWIEGTTLRRLDNGRYVTLDHPASLVRSTISIAFSHDGSLFASTHGDHTVKVFEYPSGKQVACLDGHPRTPWTVRFHPTDNRFIASGCLGYDCRIWDVSKSTCIRRHTFRNSISCVSFSPDGDLLAVTSGRQLLLWDYWKDTRDPNRAIVTSDNDFHPNNRLRNQQQNLVRASSNAGNSNPPQDPGIPRELLEGDNPFHMVDFHPSGTMLMTGEKNRYQQSPSSNQSANGNNSHTDGNTNNNNANAPTGTTATTNNNNQPAGANGNNQNNAANNNTNARSENQTNTNGTTNTTTANTTGTTASSSDEQQFTLKLVVHRFDRRMERRFSEPVLEVPRAVAYNDAGIHFSPCGTMLAACIPSERIPKGFRIAVLSLVPRRSAPVGTVLYETALDRGHVTALTNLKFSSTSDHLLAGFSFRPTNPVLRGQAETYDASVRQNELRIAQAQADAAGGAGRGGGGRGGGRGGARMDNGTVLDSPPPLPQVQVVDIYRVGQKFPLIRSLCADMDVSDGHSGGAEDEINVAVFAPAAGIADGVVYGTQKGRIRLFQLATGPFDKLEKIKGTVKGSVPLQNRVPNNLASVGHHRNNGPMPGHIRMQPRGRALAAALHPNSNLTTSNDRNQIYPQQQGRAHHPGFDVDNENNRTHHAARSNHHPQQRGSVSRSDASYRQHDLSHVHYAPISNSATSNQTTSGFLPHRNTITNANNTSNISNNNPVIDLSRMFERRQFMNGNDQIDNRDSAEIDSDAENVVDGDGDVVVGDAEGAMGRATAVLIDDDDDDDDDTNNALYGYIQLEDPSVRSGSSNVHMSNSHHQAHQSQTSVTHQPPQQPQSQSTSQAQGEPPRNQAFGFGRSAVGVGLGLLTQAGLFRRFRQVQMAATTTANIHHNIENEGWPAPATSSSAAGALSESNADGVAANQPQGNESRAFLQVNNSSVVSGTSSASSAATNNCAAASNGIDHRPAGQAAQAPPNQQQQTSAQGRRHNNHPNNNLVPMYDNLADGIAPAPTRHNSL